MENVKDLQDYIKRLERLINNVYDACTCERFKTKGFDYSETHPFLGKPCTGGRWNTPKGMIEAVIGFKWKYENPEGVSGSSWKELQFRTIEKKDGYY